MWRSAGLAGALGIEITLCFVIGGGAGYLLDRKLNTHWIMYVGLFFGLGAAIKGIMRVVKAYKRETAEAVKNDKPASGQNGGGDAGAN
jgi:F0F1-type ATP synthase assembly protein I